MRPVQTKKTNIRRMQIWFLSKKGDVKMILDRAEHVREYTAKGWWGDTTLADLFARNVERTPEATALVDPPNRSDLLPGKPEHHSYQDLKILVDRLAGGLLELGLKKDDVLMYQLPNTVEVVVVCLAAARLGIIISPAPVQYRTHELNQIMPLVQPKAFVMAAEFNGFDHLEMVRALQPQYPGLDSVIAFGQELPVVFMHCNPYWKPREIQDRWKHMWKKTLSVPTTSSVSVGHRAPKRSPKGFRAATTIGSPRPRPQWMAQNWSQVAACSTLFQWSTFPA